MRKSLSLLFALLFVLFASFQYNDPDPQLWIPIYGFAAMACLMAYARVGRWWFFAGMAVMYAVAAWYQWPPAFEGFWLDEMGMKTLNVELAREAGGLVICAAAMILMGWLVRKG